ncbi:MAG: 30S ribosomal protein S19e [Candidatus Diapherotrites archaeon]|nr:30S ribosomal protein S19e [Candidatus Diapherotrites archaeon]
MKAFDVAPNKIVNATALELEKQGLKMPEWAVFVKTGSHRERTPTDTKWWYNRLASVLYRVYKDGPVGTQRLRTYYGGRKNRGVKPHAFRKAGGKIIRVCLQELEKQGLIKKNKSGGRVISGRGASLLDKISKAALKLAEEEKAKTVERRAVREKRIAQDTKKSREDTVKKAKPEKKKKEKQK